MNYDISVSGVSWVVFLMEFTWSGLAGVLVIFWGA